MSGPQGKPPLSEPANDDRLFEEAMRGVRPLEKKGGGSPVAAIADPSPLKGQEVARRRADADRAPRGGQPLVALERWGERYTLAAAGVDRRSLAALRSGEPAPQAELDLHGLDAAEALSRVEALLRRAEIESWRCLLVVHGRGRGSGPGGPVLRERLLDALIAGHLGGLVLAAVDAPTHLGGAGAGLWLLRRTRR